MFNATAIKLMNSKQDKTLNSILDIKKQTELEKDKNENSSDGYFSINFWGQGPEKDDLTFFDLKMILDF